jgi:hypothetical protein
MRAGNLARNALPQGFALGPFTQRETGARHHATRRCQQEKRRQHQRDWTNQRAGAFQYRG